MSKIKQSLDENFSVLQGDELEPKIEATYPPIEDWAVEDLRRAVLRLKEVKPYQYTDELKKIAILLNWYIKDFEKPF